MTGWIVLLAILSFFYLVSLIRFKFTIEYDDELRMDVRIMHLIRIPISPPREKKTKLSEYTPKAIAKREQKRLEKEAKKAQKKLEKKQKKIEKKQAKKTQPKKNNQSKRSLADNISLITDVLGIFLKRFFRHLKIDFARIHISVASEDAAQTAILYGIISQSVSYLLEVMKLIKTVSPPDLSDVSVTPDWVSEETQVDIKISISMSIGNVFDILGRTIGRAISHLFRDMKKQAKSPQHRFPPKQPAKPQSSKSKSDASSTN